MQNMALFLRHHAYELTSLAHDCTEVSIANQLEKFAFLMLAKASHVDQSAPALEP